MMHTYFVNDEVYSIQHYVINLSVTCDRSMVFFGYSCFPTNKTGCHDITEILLKVTLSTITLTLLTGTLGIIYYRRRSRKKNITKKICMLKLNKNFIKSLRKRKNYMKDDKQRKKKWTRWTKERCVDYLPGQTSLSFDVYSVKFSFDIS